MSYIVFEDNVFVPNNISDERRPKFLFSELYEEKPSCRYKLAICHRISYYIIVNCVSCTLNRYNNDCIDVNGFKEELATVVLTVQGVIISDDVSKLEQIQNSCYKEFINNIVAFWQDTETMLEICDDLLKYLNSEKNNLRYGSESINSSIGICYDPDDYKSYNHDDSSFILTEEIDCINISNLLRIPIDNSVLSFYSAIKDEDEIIIYSSKKHMNKKIKNEEWEEYSVNIFYKDCYTGEERPIEMQ